MSGPDSDVLEVEVRAPATSRALCALTGLGLVVLGVVLGTSLAASERQMFRDVSVYLTGSPALAVGIVGLVLLVAAAVTDGRPVAAGVGALLVAAGVAVVAATDGLLAELAVGRRTGWVLVLAGSAALLASALHVVEDEPELLGAPPDPALVAFDPASNGAQERPHHP